MLRHHRLELIRSKILNACGRCSRAKHESQFRGRIYPPNWVAQTSVCASRYQSQTEVCATQKGSTRGRRQKGWISIEDRMSPGDWIGLGIIALVIVGGLLLLNQITKPYDVKDEEEFQRRRREGGRATGLMGLQGILQPAAKKAIEVQQDLRRGIYDDE